MEGSIATACLACLLLLQPALAAERPRKILIGVSSGTVLKAEELPQANSNLWETAPPYHVFVMHGYQVDLVSPRGGRVPFSRDVDEVDPPGMISYTIRYEGFREKADNTLTPQQVKPEDYAAYFVGGGFGPLFDMASDRALLSVISKIYEAGGVVGGCGHGPGSLAGVQLRGGQYLVAGKKVTGFPNSSEKTSKWTRGGTLLPFLVEDALRARGARFLTKEDLPDKHDVVIGDRIVTTMFLPSCANAAKEMVELLHKAP